MRLRTSCSTRKTTNRRNAKSISFGGSQMRRSRIRLTIELAFNFAPFSECHGLTALNICHPRQRKTTVTFNRQTCNASDDENCATFALTSCCVLLFTHSFAGPSAHGARCWCLPQSCDDDLEWVKKEFFIFPGNSDEFFQSFSTDTLTFTCLP